MSRLPPKGAPERTAAARARIAEMHAQGWKQKDIARDLGWDRKRIYYHAKALGLTFPVGRRAGEAKP